MGSDTFWKILGTMLAPNLRGRASRKVKAKKFLRVERKYQFFFPSVSADFDPREGILLEKKYKLNLNLIRTNEIKKMKR